MAEVSGGFPVPSAPLAGTYMTLFTLPLANFNSALDQALLKAWDFTVYVIKEVLVTSPSGPIANARGGIYTGASKSGVPVIAATQSYTALSSSTDTLNPLLNNGATATLSAPLYLSLTTPEGSAATASISIMGLAN